MANFFPSSLAAPAPLAPPAALVPARLGPDVLASLAADTPEAQLESMAGGTERVTLAELLAHNAAPTLPPSPAVAGMLALLDPVRKLAVLVRLLGARGGEQFQLEVVERPPFQGLFFLLRARIPFDARAEALERQAAREAQVRAETNELSALLEAADASGLDLFLEELVLDREQDLASLRQLIGVHRDSVQNAVDIVQTKRIDFLESPQETGLAGSAMAFVVTTLLTETITSALGGVMKLVLTGAFAVTGGGFRRGRQANLSQFFSERRKSLDTLAVALKSSQDKLSRLDRGRPKSSNALSAALAKRAEAFQGYTPPKFEKELAIGSIAEDAIARAARLMARLAQPEKRADGSTDDVAKVAGALMAKPAAAIAQVVESTAQARPDAGNPLAVPVDVAMKMEVQDYFEPWLQAAEASVGFLRLVRLVLRRTGDLPQEVLQELFDSLGGAQALREFRQGAQAFTAELPGLRASLTSHYELLLWLTLYHHTIGRARRIAIPAQHGSGLHRGPSKEVIAIPAEPATRNLLRYLALRHFGLGKTSASGEVTFSDDELRGCVLGLEMMSNAMFNPTDSQVLPGGGVVPALQVVSVRYQR
jgi:hypothetical protein